MNKKEKFLYSNSLNFQVGGPSHVVGSISINAPTSPNDTQVEDSNEPETKDTFKANSPDKTVDSKLAFQKAGATDAKLELESKKALETLLKDNPKLTSVSRNYYNENGEKFAILFDKSGEDKWVDWGYKAYFAKPGEDFKPVEGELNVYRGSGQEFTSSDGSIKFYDLTEGEKSLNGLPIIEFH